MKKYAWEYVRMLGLVGGIFLIAMATHGEHVAWYSIGAGILIGIYWKD